MSKRRHRVFKLKKQCEITTEWLYSIPKKKRIFIIKKYITTGKRFCKSETLEGRRKKFNLVKDVLLPIIPDTLCYLCDLPARDRHHVIPLCKHGPNKSWNLLPMCRVCHTKITKFQYSAAFKRFYGEGQGKGSLLDKQRILFDIDRKFMNDTSNGSLSSCKSVVFVKNSPKIDSENKS